MQGRGDRPPRRPSRMKGTATPAGAPFIDRPGGRFNLLEVAPELLLALKEHNPGLLDETGALAPGGPAMAGDLATFPPSDLLNFLHHGQREGALLARSEGVERAVVLLEGNVAWACSTGPAERLGEVACRMGLADRARVNELARTQGSARGRRPIGQMLVEAGAMRAEDLPRAVRHQVVEIFLGLLVARTGAFLFLRGCDRERLPSQLALDTEAMLLDGLRRLDEMELFRARIPGLHVHPRRTGKDPLDELPDEARLVLDMCQGALTLGQIAAATGLGEFEATRVTYRLVVAGLAAVEE
jgi:hypothetical protein